MRTVRQSTPASPPAASAVTIFNGDGDGDGDDANERVDGFDGDIDSNLIFMRVYMYTHPNYPPRTPKHTHTQFLLVLRDIYYHTLSTRTGISLMHIEIERTCWMDGNQR